jgi:hypothetical protein
LGHEGSYRAKGAVAAKTALAKLWPIFDYRCGQRLAYRQQLGNVQLAFVRCGQSSSGHFAATLPGGRHL